MQASRSRAADEGGGAQPEAMDVTRDWVWVFQSLALLTRRGSRCLLNVPETVVFTEGRPALWVSTDSEGAFVSRPVPPEYNAQLTDLAFESLETFYWRQRSDAPAAHHVDDRGASAPACLVWYHDGGRETLTVDAYRHLRSRLDWRARVRAVQGFIRPVVSYTGRYVAPHVAASPGDEAGEEEGEPVNPALDALTQRLAHYVEGAHMQGQQAGASPQQLSQGAVARATQQLQAQQTSDAVAAAAAIAAVAAVAVHEMARELAAQVPPVCRLLRLHGKFLVDESGTLWFSHATDVLVRTHELSAAEREHMARGMVEAAQPALRAALAAQQQQQRPTPARSAAQREAPSPTVPPLSLPAGRAAAASGGARAADAGSAAATAPAADTRTDAAPGAASSAAGNAARALRGATALFRDLMRAALGSGLSLRQCFAHFAAGDAERVSVDVFLEALGRLGVHVTDEGTEEVAAAVGRDAEGMITFKSFARCLADLAPAPAAVPAAGTAQSGGEPPPITVLDPDKLLPDWAAPRAKRAVTDLQRAQKDLERRLQQQREEEAAAEAAARRRAEQEGEAVDALGAAAPDVAAHLAEGAVSSVRDSLSTERSTASTVGMAATAQGSSAAALETFTSPNTGATLVFRLHSTSWARVIPAAAAAAEAAVTATAAAEQPGGGEAPAAPAVTGDAALLSGTVRPAAGAVGSAAAQRAAALAAQARGLSLPAPPPPPLPVSSVKSAVPKAAASAADGAVTDAAAATAAEAPDAAAAPPALVRVVVLCDALQTVEAAEECLERVLARNINARTLIIGLPGHPGTSWPTSTRLTNESLATAAADLLLQLRYWNQSGQWESPPAGAASHTVLVGFGNGANVALALATLCLSVRPYDVIAHDLRAIVAVNPFAHVTRAMARTFRELRSALGSAPRAEAVQALLSALFSPAFLAAHPHREIAARFFRTRSSLLHAPAAAPADGRAASRGSRTSRTRGSARSPSRASPSSPPRSPQSAARRSRSPSRRDGDTGAAAATATDGHSEPHGLIAPLSLRQLADAERHVDLRPYLPALRVPLLLSVSGDNAFIPPSHAHGIVRAMGDPLQASSLQEFASHAVAATCPRSETDGEGASDAAGGAEEVERRQVVLLQEMSGGHEAVQEGGTALPELLAHLASHLARILPPAAAIQAAPALAAPMPLGPLRAVWRTGGAGDHTPTSPSRSRRWLADVVSPTRASRGGASRGASTGPYELLADIPMSDALRALLGEDGGAPRLRLELERRGLSLAGDKRELVERLDAAVQAETRTQDAMANRVRAHGRRLQAEEVRERRLAEEARERARLAAAAEQRQMAQAARAADVEAAREMARKREAREMAAEDVLSRSLRRAEFAQWVWQWQSKEATERVQERLTAEAEAARMAAEAAEARERAEKREVARLRLEARRKAEDERMFGSLEGLADPDTLVVPPSAELQELAATATQVCGEVERVLETRWGAAAKHATATERVQRAQAEVDACLAQQADIELCLTVARKELKAASGRRASVLAEEVTSLLARQQRVAQSLAGGGGRLEDAREQLARVDAHLQRFAAALGEREAALEALRAQLQGRLRGEKAALATCRRQEAEAAAEREELEQGVLGAETRYKELTGELARVRDVTDKYVDTSIWQRGVPQRIRTVELKKFLETERGVVENAVSKARASIRALRQTEQGSQQAALQHVANIKLMTAELARMQACAERLVGRKRGEDARTLQQRAEVARKAEEEARQRATAAALKQALAGGEGTEAGAASDAAAEADAAAAPRLAPATAQLFAPGETDALARLVRAKPADERATEERRWVALDRVLNPDLYIGTSPEDEEVMRHDPAYRTQLDRATLQRLMVLPRHLAEAAVGLHSEAETRAFALLHKFALGRGVEWSRELDAASCQHARARQARQQQPHARIDFTRPGSARALPPAQPESAPAPAPAPAPAAGASGEPTILVSSLPEAVSALPHGPVLMRLGQWEPLLRAAELALGLRQSRHHTFAVPAASTLLELRVSVTSTGVFQARGYVPSRVGVALFRRRGRDAAAAAAGGDAAAGGSAALQRIGWTPPEAVFLCSPTAPGRLTVQHTPRHLPIPAGEYEVVVTAGAPCTYTVEVAGRRGCSVEEALQRAVAEMAEKEKSLPVLEAELQDITLAVRLSQRKEALCEQLIGDAEGACVEAERERAALAERLEDDDALEDMTMAQIRRARRRIAVLDAHFATNARLVVSRRQELADVKAGGAQLRQAQALRQSQIAAARKDILGLRQVLPRVLAALTGAPDAGDMDYSAIAASRAVLAAVSSSALLRDAAKASLPHLMTAAQRVRRKPQLELTRAERQWRTLDKVLNPDAYTAELGTARPDTPGAAAGGTALPASPGGGKRRAQRGAKGAQSGESGDETAGEAGGVPTREELQWVLRANVRDLTRRQLRYRAILQRYPDELGREEPGVSTARTARPTSRGSTARSAGTARKARGVQGVHSLGFRARAKPVDMREVEEQQWLALDAVLRPHLYDAETGEPSLGEEEKVWRARYEQQQKQQQQQQNRAPSASNTRPGLIGHNAINFDAPPTTVDPPPEPAAAGKARGRGFRLARAEAERRRKLRAEATQRRQAAAARNAVKAKALHEQRRQLVELVEKGALMVAVVDEADAQTDRGASTGEDTAGEGDARTDEDEEQATPGAPESAAAARVQAAGTPRSDQPKVLPAPRPKSPGLFREDIERVLRSAPATLRGQRERTALSLYQKYEPSLVIGPRLNDPNAVGQQGEETRASGGRDPNSALHAVEAVTDGVTAAVDLDARCKAVLRELDRATVCQTEFTDSAVLHGAAQRFRTTELRAQLERDLDQLLISQVRERERLLRMAEGGRDASDGSDGSGSGSGTDASESDAETAEEASSKPRTATAPAFGIADLTGVNRPADVTKRQERAAAQKRQRTSGYCFACHTSPCPWRPTGDAEYFTARRVELQRELDSIRMLPPSVTMVETTVPRSVVDGGEARMIRETAVAEISKELSQLGLKLRLLEVDRELHASHAAREEFIEVSSLHGYSQLMWRLDAVKSLEGEVTRMVARQVAIEATEDILDWMLEGWMFGERTSALPAVGYVPSIKRNGPVRIHEAKANLLAERLQQQRTQEVLTAGALRPAQAVAGAAEAAEAVAEQSVAMRTGAGQRPSRSPSQPPGPRTTLMAKWEPIAAAAQERAAQQARQEEQVQSKRELAHTEQTLKFGLFLIAMNYFRSMTMLKREQRSWREPHAISQLAGLRAAAATHERQRMNEEEANRKMRQDALRLAATKAAMGAMRRANREQREAETRRRKLQQETRRRQAEQAGATKLQAFYRGHLGRLRARQVAAERAAQEAGRARRWAAALTLQRVWRGHMGRRAADEKREELAEFVAKLQAEELGEEENSYWKSNTLARWRRNVQNVVRRMGQSSAATHFTDADAVVPAWYRREREGGRKPRRGRSAAQRLARDAAGLGGSDSESDEDEEEDESEEEEDEE